MTVIIAAAELEAEGTGSVTDSICCHLTEHAICSSTHLRCFAAPILCFSLRVTDDTHVHTQNISRMFLVHPRTERGSLIVGITRTSSGILTNGYNHDAKRKKPFPVICAMMHSSDVLACKRCSKNTTHLDYSRFI